MKNKVIEELNVYLKSNLSKKRYNHIISVQNTAITLGKIYNEDLIKLEIAALGHDLTKEVDNKKQKEIILKYFDDNKDLLKVPKAWHGYTATIFLQEKFKVKDEQILNAIKYHTLGHKDMDNIAKIIYIADFIEPTRTLSNLKYYQDLVFKYNYKLDKVIYIILKDNVDYLQSQNYFIPKQTIELLDILEYINEA